MALGDDRVDDLVAVASSTGTAVDVDARHHHLVHALLSQLEHGADHLLLLGLDDALFAAALDEDHQLLGRHPLLVLLADAEESRRRVGQRGQQPHQRSEDAAEEIDRRREDECQALRVGERDGRGTSSPKTIVISATINVTIRRAMTPAELASDGMSSSRALEVVDDARPGEGGGEEADERDADLDRCQEAPGLADEPVDPLRAAVALVDELLDARPTHADERVLGQHEEGR